MPQMTSVLEGCIQFLYYYYKLQLQQQQQLLLLLLLLLQLLLLYFFFIKLINPTIPLCRPPQVGEPSGPGWGWRREVPISGSPPAPMHAYD